jgi:hypothetical protein
MRALQAIKARVALENEEFDFNKILKLPSIVVKGVTFKRKSDATPKQVWFSGKFKRFYVQFQVQDSDSKDALRVSLYSRQPHTLQDLVDYIDISRSTAAKAHLIDACSALLEALED